MADFNEVTGNKKNSLVSEGQKITPEKMNAVNDRLDQLVNQNVTSKQIVHRKQSSSEVGAPRLYVVNTYANSAASTVSVSNSGSTGSPIGSSFNLNKRVGSPLFAFDMVVVVDADGTEVAELIGRNDRPVKILPKLSGSWDRTTDVLSVEVEVMMRWGFELNAVSVVSRTLRFSSEGLLIKVSDENWVNP